MQPKKCTSGQWKATCLKRTKFDLTPTSCYNYMSSNTFIQFYYNVNENSNGGEIINTAKYQIKLL